MKFGIGAAIHIFASAFAIITTKLFRVGFLAFGKSRGGNQAKCGQN